MATLHAVRSPLAEPSQPCGVLMATPILRAVLGAPDHEMEAIRRLLTGAGIPCIDATSPGREAARLAYESAIRPAPGDVWVECAPARGDGLGCGDANADVGGICQGCPTCWGGKNAIVSAGGVVVDHHFPGDPGFGRPAHEAFTASSLGQVWSLLRDRGLTPRWSECGDCGAGAVECVDGLCGLCGGAYAVVSEPSRALRFTGEADHALAAFAVGALSASQADAVEFLANRAGVPEEDVEAAQEAILSAPELPWTAPSVLPLLPVAQVMDLRGNPDLAPGGRLGKAVVTAAVCAGVAYVGWGTQGLTAQGRHVSFGGAGEGSTQGALPMREILTALGCVGVYGDPTRGVGGGYLPAHSETT